MGSGIHIPIQVDHALCHAAALMPQRCRRFNMGGEVATEANIYCYIMYALLDLGKCACYNKKIFKVWVALERVAYSKTSN